MLSSALAAKVAERWLPRGTATSEVATLAVRAERAVYRLDTDAGRYVVKLDSGPAAFRKEQRALELLSDLGFPVQRAIGCDDGSPSVMLLPWTPGSSLSRASSVRSQQGVGLLLRRLHKQSATLGTPPPGGQTWAEWMNGWLHHAQNYWHGTGRAPPDVVPRVEGWFRRAWPLLQQRGADLILFDGRPEHWLIDPQDAVALIDVAEVRAGDGLMDLALLKLWEPQSAAEVLRAYALTDVEQITARQLLPFYGFLRALAAAEWDRSALGGGQELFWLDIGGQILEAASPT